MIAFSDVRGSPNGSFERHFHGAPRQERRYANGHELTATATNMPPWRATRGAWRPIPAACFAPRAKASIHDMGAAGERDRPSFQRTMTTAQARLDALTLRSKH